jgi:hypothetical protein
MTFSPEEVTAALDVADLDAALINIFAGRERKNSFYECALLMHEQREEFVAALQEVSDDEDLRVLIACRYIEQKSRWLQWNLSMNYKMMLTGTFDVDIAMKASALSYLLGRIEPFIDAESLGRINEMLNEPIFASAPE